MTVTARTRPWLGAALLLLGCAGCSGLTAVDEDGDRIPLRIVSDFRQPDSTQTPATIETASISGDTLHLRLSYAGGCGAPHKFGLAASNNLTESDPPQVTVILHHDGHNDTCRAGLGHTVIADLRPLQGIAGNHRTLQVRLYEPWTLHQFSRSSSIASSEVPILDSMSLGTSSGAMMRPTPMFLVLIALGMSPPQGASAQGPPSTVHIPGDLADGPKAMREAVAIPDSVRQRIGYHHWRGGAIGGTAGAIAGLLLGLAAGRACNDCTSSDSAVLETTLTGAGLGGAFGFLVGAASPKYRWIPRGGEAESPSSSD